MYMERYLRIILTVIAIELLWIGVKDFAPEVSAQAEPARSHRRRGGRVSPRSRAGASGSL